MKLRDWRKRENLTLKELAERLGIGDEVNPSSRMRRLEIGEYGMDSIIAEKILIITRGEVSLRDLNETRREALEGNRA